MFSFASYNSCWSALTSELPDATDAPVLTAPAGFFLATGFGYVPKEVFG